MKAFTSRARTAGFSGLNAAPMANAVTQRRLASGFGAGHRPNQMRAGDVPKKPSMWQFVKNVAWDDPAHEFQFQSRQRIADTVAKSQTFYGKTLVGRVNRALDRAGYDLPEHMGSSIAQNVADESEGKITQSQAHAREAGMFGGHLIKEGLLGGNKEARDPIFALGATLNATGAVASRAAELYARNPDDDTRPPWYD